MTSSIRSAQSAPEPRMEAWGRPRVLCVDDDKQLLDGLALHLRSKYEVLMASSGKDALEIIEQGLSFAVIISDMRMPEMDGAAFLSRAAAIAPDTVRVVLTGQANVDNAIAAVNDGKIFRFLTKPCPPPAIMRAVEAATERNRLVTAERILLEQTLQGTVKALIDVLALTNPVSFGHAVRIQKTISDLTIQLGMEERWQVEIAGMLSQLGAITLPEDVAVRAYAGQPLTSSEREMVDRVPAITKQFLGHIPRLEKVREIISAHHSSRPRVDEDPIVARGSQILRVAVDFDVLESQGIPPSLAVDTMLSRSGRYSADVLQALVTLHRGGSHQSIVEIGAGELRVGMVLADDVKMSNGVLFVTRGFEVTPSMIERIRNFQTGTLREPLRVLLKEDKRARS